MYNYILQKLCMYGFQIHVLYQKFGLNYWFKISLEGVMVVVVASFLFYKGFEYRDTCIPIIGCSVESYKMCELGDNFVQSSNSLSVENIINYQ